MRCKLILILLVCLSLQTSAQSHDYEEIRDTVFKITCGKVDSMQAVNRRISLENFDTNSVTSNIKLYYSDLGWTYYLLCLHTEDTAFIRPACRAYTKALYHDPKYSAALYHLSFFNYYFYKDCIKGKYYMDRYKKATRKKYWQNEQIKSLVKRCE